VDYKKWDKLAEDVDDEEEERAEQDRSAAAGAGLERDLDREGDRFAAYARGSLKEATDEECRTAGYFIAGQAKGRGEDHNLHHHVDIIKMLQRWPWLISEDWCQRMCVIQRHVQKLGEGKPEKEEAKFTDDSHTIISAVNVLAACLELQGVVQMFQCICSPASDAAKQARAKYEKAEYARPYVLQGIMGKDKYDEMQQLLEKEPDDEGWSMLLGVGAVAVVFLAAFIAALVKSVS